MFRKRPKKTFPPGTFIPTPARVLAIIQLCLAFTVILWNVSLPFMGELFDLRSEQLLVYDVMGVSPDQLSGSLAEISKVKADKLQRNKIRFEALPLEERQKITKQSEGIAQKAERSFFAKSASSLYLVYEIPAFEQVWILLSLAVPILLLKRVEGAHYVVWLLPLVTLFYAIDNRWNGTPAFSAEERLFPTEKIIVDHYLDEPLSKQVTVQQTQLMQGWKRFLIKEWAKEAPSPDSSVFEEQAERGEFAFNRVRLDAKESDKKMHKLHLHHQESLFLLGIYLFWNLLFALVAWKKRVT